MMVLWYKKSKNRAKKFNKSLSLFNVGDNLSERWNVVEHAPTAKELEKV